MGGSKLRIELNGLVEQRQRLVDRRPCSPMKVRHGAQIVIVGIEISGRLPRGTLDLRPLELGGDRSDDAGRDLILKLEDIVECSCESIGPKVGAGRRIDELSRDTNPVFGLAYTAFDDIAHAKLAPHLFLVHRPALVGETRVVRDHEQPANARQGRDDLLDNPVGKIILRDVATEIPERQDRDRRGIGQG
ncbi:hypothetical protein V1289_001547 [Bradyrhizobium sp. AZCC 2289]